MSASVCGVAHLRLLEQPHDGIAVVASGFQMRFHARPGCNEIFMQSQRVLAAENAKDARLMPRSRPASGL